MPLSSELFKYWEKLPFFLFVPYSLYTTNMSDVEPDSNLTMYTKALTALAFDLSTRFMIKNRECERRCLILKKK